MANLPHFEEENHEKSRFSSFIGWQYAIAAGSESDPRTERKPELFQKRLGQSKK